MISFRIQPASSDKVNFIFNEKQEESDSVPSLESSKSRWNQICIGDSGRRHWTFNSKENRATLICISTLLTEDWRGSAAVIHKITYPSKYDWINIQANIPTQASSST